MVQIHLGPVHITFAILTAEKRSLCQAHGSKGLYLIIHEWVLGSKPIRVPSPILFKSLASLHLGGLCYNGAVFHTEFLSICGELITCCEWPVSPVLAQARSSSVRPEGRGRAEWISALCTAVQRSICTNHSLRHILYYMMRSVNKSFVCYETVVDKFRRWTVAD